ncbi:MAG TPA: DUF2182 domain-containing protein [Steroidobacteraceae bacterium]
MKVDSVTVAAALAFAASAAVTVAWCGAMADMPGMDMPGGWQMSMAWMRMAGQGWLACAVTFLGMWGVMMIAMMMPVLAPMLARHRRAMKESGGVDRPGLSACVVAGYFFIWMLAGLALFPPGALLADWAMREPAVSRAMPISGALIVLAAGALQFTRWKSRRLAGCRHTLDCCRDLEPHARAAWRHGLELGLRCVYCCASLTAVLIVIGVMDLLAMALVTMAISAERLSPERLRADFVVGAALLAGGAWMMCKAVAP